MGKPVRSRSWFLSLFGFDSRRVLIVDSVRLSIHTTGEKKRKPILGKNFHQLVSEKRKRDRPIALYNGSPVTLSHKTVVSRWFVMPTAIISLATIPWTCNIFTVSSMHSTTAFIISLGSCSTHPACGYVLATFFWYLATILAVVDENTCKIIIS